MALSSRRRLARGDGRRLCSWVTSAADAATATATDDDDDDDYDDETLLKMFIHPPSIIFYPLAVMSAIIRLYRGSTLVRKHL